jgi:hypothetical protein
MRVLPKFFGKIFPEYIGWIVLGIKKGEGRYYWDRVIGSRIQSLEKSDEKTQNLDIGKTGV